MATTADFKGLDWLAHRLHERTDLTEHHKVECVWTLFPTVPQGLLLHALTLGQHDSVRCPLHIAPDEVVMNYVAWRPGTASWGSTDVSASSRAPQPSRDTSETPPAPPAHAEGADEPAINGLLHAAEHLLSCLDELRVFESSGWYERRSYFRGRDRAAIVKGITAREHDLRQALNAFSAEQHEHSEEQRVAEEQS